MEQEKIALIALLASVTGILLLFAMAQSIEPKEMRIQEITIKECLQALREKFKFTKKNLSL